MFLYIAILIAILLGLIYEQNACPAYSPRRVDMYLRYRSMKRLWRVSEEKIQNE